MFFFQVSLVDKELSSLAREKEENARRLNTKRTNHIATLQQLGTNKKCRKHPILGLIDKRNFRD